MQVASGGFVVARCGVFVYYSVNGHASVQSSELDRRRTRHSGCLLYTSPSPRDGLLSRMPSSA